LIGRLFLLTACLLGGAGSALAKPAVHRAADREGPCHAAPDLDLWVAPRVPVAGAPLKVLVVAEAPFDAPLLVDGVPHEGHARGGPPFSLEVDLGAARAGALRIEVARPDKAAACVVVKVAPHAPAIPRSSVIWENRRAWDRHTESFYAAYVESLFDAAPKESLAFRPLAQALRDPARNFLWNYLGLREDDAKNKQALPAAPDCADLPYFTRAYVSWKLGLPFGFRDCDRGNENRPPKCGELVTNLLPAEGKEPLAAMRSFVRLLANKVHSGSARAALDDEATDTYPVALTRENLRPGTIYADPYGHVLMVAKWVPQTAEAGGILFAVDGQPDQSIGRKRFWEGNFLFASDVKSAGPGFKAFRPLEVSDGKVKVLGNAALAHDGRFAGFSDEQAHLSPDAFYARLGKLINPQGLDAAAAYRETFDALVEQLTTRVGSVENGETYMRENHEPVVPMPEGAKIFETVGPWEDYATPSRDMRLLIAMHVLETLPDRIVAHPDLFLLGGRKPEVVKAEIQKLHETSIHDPQRRITYFRSDRSPFTLTVAELLSRKAAFEQAFNPNDCAEARWGAPEGSPEMATCKRHAPPDQRARMADMRAWFHETRRPPR